MFQQGPKVPNETLDGPGGSVSQGANGVAFDLLGKFLQHVNVRGLCGSTYQPIHDGSQPARAFTTRRTLSTRFVLIKARQSSNGGNQIRALVHHDDGRRAKATLDITKGIKVHQHLVAHGLGQQGHGRAAWDDGQQIVPAATNAATMTLDELAQWDAHGLFDRAGSHDMARDGKQLGARVLGSTKGRKPRAAPTTDGWGHGHGLHIGHRGGTAKETDVRWKGRLKPWLACFALDAFNQGRLFATDVRACAPMDVDVKGIIAATGILSD